MDKARAESLVKWINKLEGSTPCSCLEELASGEILLNRMQTIFPQLQEAGSRDPWDCLLEALEEFCNCAPSKFLHLQGLSQGNVEQIGRVVVIFLCMAVQKKPNEDIIAGITSLDPFAQRDIMFFIENTLGKMETHALMTGEFTSGIGEQLPQLEEPSNVSECPSNMPELQPDIQKASNPVPPSTPSRSRFARQSAYDGLASPAAARWLLTPVMGKKGRPVPDTNLAPAGEEVLVLKHKVRVLEKRLETESKMARDFHTELCQLSKEHEYLKMKCSEAEGKVKHVRNVQDLEDELEEYREKLSKAEKSLGRFQDDMETLVMFKKRCSELEKKVLELEPAQAKLEECQTRVENLNTLLGEQRTHMKQQQLHFGTLEVQLKVKSEQLENSIQQAAKLSEELKDMHLTQRLARESEANLEREKERLQEELQVTVARFQEHQQEAKVRMDGLSARFESQCSELKSALATVETLRAQLEANEHQLSISGQQMTALCSRHGEEVCQLQGELQQVKLQCRRVTEEAQRVAGAILGDKVSEESGSMVVYNLKQVESLWPKKQQELSSLREHCAVLQGSLGEARGTVEKLEGELKESRQENYLLKESLSKAQLETKRTQLDLQRVAKSLADLKVSSSLLEVQLDQSRDTVRQALQQKSAVEENLFQVRESNCVLQSEQNDLKAKCLALEADLKSALEQKSAVHAQLTTVSKQLAACEEELAAAQALAKEQLRLLHAEVVDAQEANGRLQMELQLSAEEMANTKSELLISQQTLAKTMLEHQDKGAQLKKEFEQQIVQLQAEHDGRLQAEHRERDEQLQAEHKKVVENEAKVKCLQSEHEKLIEQLQNEHATNVEQLQTKHGKVLEQLKSEHGMEMERLKLEQEKLIEQLQNEQVTNVEQLQTKHGKVLEQLKSEHGLEMERLKLEQEKIIEQLRTDHGTQMEHLQTEHLKAIEQLNSEHVSTVDQLKSDHGVKVEQLRSEQEKMIEQLQTELSLAYEATKSMEEEVNKKLQEAHGNMTATQAELAVVHDRLAASKEEVAMLTAQHKQHVEKLLARLEEAEEEVRAKEKAEAALREEVQLVREQKDKNEHELIQLRTEMEGVKVQLVDLARRSTVVEEELSSTKQQLVSADKETRRIQEQLCSAGQKLIVSQEENKRLLADYKLEIETKEAELSRLQGQLEVAQSEGLSKAKDLSQLQNELLLAAEQKRAAECETCSLHVELENAKLQLADLNKSSMRLAQDKEALKEQLYSAEQQLVCAKKSQEESGHLQEAALKAEMEKRIDLEAKFTEMEIYSAAIEHERARLESEAKSKQEAMQSLQEAKLQLEMEVANAQVQVTMKNQTMAELNFSNRRLRDESTQHQEWCKALEMQLKGATEQLDKVKSVHNDTISKLEADCSECRTEVASLKDKLAQQSGLHERQCDELQKENCALLKRQSQLHEELQRLHQVQHEADRMCREYKEAYEKESEKVQQLSEYKEAYTKESERVQQLSEYKEAYTKESERVQQLLEYKESYLREAEKVQQLLEYKEAYTKEAERVQQLLEYKEAYIMESDKVQQLLKRVTHVQDERNEQVKCLGASLEKEQRQTIKMAADIKSLQAQLAYAEQRLRDIEHGRNQVLLTSNPSLHCQLASKQDDTNSRPSSTDERFGNHLSRDLDAAVQKSVPAVFNEGIAPLSRRQTLQSSIQTVAMSTTSAPSSRPSSTLPPIPEEDSAERIRELQRRNTKTLPHLKSSYPVELQVQSPSISDERIKEGTQPVRLRSRPQSMQFDIPNDESVLRRKLSKDRVDPSAGSPVATRRRLSAPQTPSTPVEELAQHHATRRLTMMPSGMKLREFLDEKENVKGPELMGAAGTSFEISFSSEGVQKPLQLPTRLAQRQEAREKEKKARAPSGLSTTSAAVGVAKKAQPKPRPAKAQKVLLSTN